MPGVVTERLDPLDRTIKWSWTVIYQIGKLRAKELEVTQTELPTHYTEDSRKPFHELDAEAYFLVAAAAQLYKGVEALGDSSVVVPGDQDTLETLRNCVEHWEQWHLNKKSPRWFRQQWPSNSPWSHSWTSNGEATLGGVLLVRDLEDFANHAYRELIRLADSS